MKLINLIIQNVEASSVQHGTIYQPFGENINTIKQVFNFIMNIITGFGWSLVFIMVALGFMQYVTSQGDKTAVDKAQKWLTYAVIGGVVLLIFTLGRTILPSLVGTDSTSINSGIGGDVSL